MKVLIIIPAYNEEESICSVVDELIQDYPQYDYVVINDCSTDRTKEICNKNEYRYIDLPINLGIGGGVSTGYCFAKQECYDIAIQLDGDAQHNPFYIKEMIRLITDGQIDMVIGSRFINRTGFQTTGIRRIGIRLLKTIIWWVCGVNITDATSGFRAVSKRLINFYSNDYAHDYPEPEAIVSASLMGYAITEIPVEMNERAGGNSSINGWKTMYYMMKVSLAILLCKLLYRRKKKL